MKTKIKGILTLLLAFVVQITFAQEKTISGTVSDTSGTLPGVSVLIKGTNKGTETDINGKYSIKAKEGDVLRFSYIGYKNLERKVGTSNNINITMLEDASVLEEVVITALGIKRSAKSLPFSSQPIKGEELQKARESNVANAIAGKIAGVQVRSQAGAKLGSAGAIRIRGSIGLTDNDALYVVDGVPGININDVNMDDVESINVLKGPNASALYGQRAANGVVVITTAKGKKGDDFKVSFNSSIEIDKVNITADYQNEYGGGTDSNWRTYTWSNLHPEEWKSLNGMRYHDFTDDASWGPKFDGGEYITWYTLYPGTSKTGQTGTYSARPNNIENLYDNAVNLVNSVTINKSGENYTSRVNYTNRDVEGIIPGTTSKRNQVSINLNLDLTEKLTFGTSVNLSNSEINGDFGDDYGSVGSAFNQWFHRDVDANVLRELNVISGNGRIPTWNLRRNPTATTAGNDVTVGNYHLNPFAYSTRQKNIANRESLYGNFNLSYEVNENITLTAKYNRKAINFKQENKTPKIIETAAVQSGIFNSYSLDLWRNVENNYEFMANYKNKFGKFGLDVNVGGNIRDNYFDRMSASSGSGLQIPDFYSLANSVDPVTPTEFMSKKQVRSLYLTASADYEGFLFLEGALRNDISSALPANANSYTYPSIGTSFLFSEFTKDIFEELSYGKLRAGWAQVGSDINAYDLTRGFGSSNPYDSSNPVLNITNTLVDPNIIVPLNESFEIGTDLRFFGNRLGISYTYFHETKDDEIQSVSISPSSGYSSYLTNAGSFKRTGHELTINATPVKTDDFTWTTALNWSTVDSQVISVNDQVDEIARRGYWALFYFTQTEGKEWGQIKGTAFKRDADGNKIINADGSYVTEADHYFGSVLPDFVGGLSNTFTYKNFSLSASVDFQKGGLFYSLSSQWGSYTGLYAETAAINDKGNNVRDAVSAGGGVRVDGVDATTGQPSTVYRSSISHYQDFFNKRLTEKNLYDASYIKLREVTLNYNLPENVIKKIGFIDSFSLSVYGRNLGLLYKHKDNPHVDPSIISQNFGEYGQQPGTRTFGTSLKISF